MGSAFGTLPSQILGLDDPWAAYQLDVAVLNLGTWVESELEKRDKQGRPKRSLETLLAPRVQDEKGRSRPAPKPASSFRSPVMMGVPVRKVKVNPDGTW